MSRCRAVTLKSQRCKNAANYPIAGSGSSRLTRCRMHIDKLVDFKSDVPDRASKSSHHKRRTISSDNSSSSDSSDHFLSSSSDDSDDGDRGNIVRNLQEQNKGYKAAVEALTTQLLGLLSRSDGKKLKTRVKASLNTGYESGYDSDMEDNKKGKKNSKKEDQKKKAKSKSGKKYGKRSY
jgi:hypothetical protein